MGAGIRLLAVTGCTAETGSPDRAASGCVLWARDFTAAGVSRYGIDDEDRCSPRALERERDSPVGTPADHLRKRIGGVE